MCNSSNNNVSCKKGQRKTYKSNYMVFPADQLGDDKYLVDFTFKLENEKDKVAVCIKIQSITIRRFKTFWNIWSDKIKTEVEEGYKQFLG